ncbi:MAG: GTP pyrophosphokinase [Candidatus Sericytochromatia bacterium]
MKRDLLDDYHRDLPLLHALKQEVSTQLETLLTASDIKIHSLSARIKSPQSLEYKLKRPDKTYRALAEVTDLVGVRLITYFEDTIDQLAAQIEQAFEIDYLRSIDKRKSADVSQFGYRSLHYICRPKGSGSKHPYAFEVQIRTILQHTWAEIEHDLGYKSTTRIPPEMRRRFSRVAGLLELADDEFIAIRSDLERYRDSVQAKLSEADTALTLDQVSLEAFLQTPEMRELEQAFAAEIGVPLSNSAFYPEYLIRMLEAVEMTELTALRSALQTHRAALFSFIQPYFAFTHRVWQFDREAVGVFRRGYSLVFLAHFLLLRSSNLGIERIDRLTQFYQHIDYPHDEAQARSVAEQLIETMQLGLG